jgi:hypothetical protein
VIVNVEAEVNKYKIKGREEIERAIQDYKNLAIQHAKDFTLAGQYNMVAQKLREICNKLPPPNLRPHTSNAPRASVKTVAINSEDKAKINAAWEKRAGRGGK